MVKWEYYGFILEESWSLTALLATAGDNGWELITVVNNRYIFKRPKND